MEFEIRAWETAAVIRPSASIVHFLSIGKEGEKEGKRGEERGGEEGGRREGSDSDLQQV